MAGVATCGLKQSGAPDLALLVSESDCSAAGVFTRNQIAAAPVLLDRETLAANPDQIRAVAANAGIANAATGADGLDDARAMQRLAAEALSLEYQQVLVLSTGVIGPRLPLDKVEIGIAEAPGRPATTLREPLRADRNLPRDGRRPSRRRTEQCTPSRTRGVPT